MSNALNIFVMFSTLRSWILKKTINQFSELAQTWLELKKAMGIQFSMVINLSFISISFLVLKLGQFSFIRKFIKNWETGKAPVWTLSNI